MTYFLWHSKPTNSSVFYFDQYLFIQYFLFDIRYLSFAPPPGFLVYAEPFAKGVYNCFIDRKTSFLSGDSSEIEKE